MPRVSERLEKLTQLLEREPNDTFPAPLLSPEGDLMILPQRHAMDGAFAARLRRTA